MAIGVTAYARAGINLNPYQGLKLSNLGLPTIIRRKAGINLNPYQGLKLEQIQFVSELKLAGINLNPYQGLKLNK